MVGGIRRGPRGIRTLSLRIKSPLPYHLGYRPEKPGGYCPPAGEGQAMTRFEEPLTVRGLMNPRDVAWALAASRASFLVPTEVTSKVR